MGHLSPHVFEMGLNGIRILSSNVRAFHLVSRHFFEDLLAPFRQNDAPQHFVPGDQFIEGCFEALLVPIREVHFEIIVAGDVSEFHAFFAPDQVRLLDIAQRKLLKAILRFRLSLWKCDRFLRPTLAARLSRASEQAVPSFGAKAASVSHSIPGCSSGSFDIP